MEGRNGRTEWKMEGRKEGRKEVIKGKNKRKE